MEEFIAAIVELLFEFLSELFIEAVVALIARSVRSLFANRSAVNPVLAGAFYFFLGNCYRRRQPVSLSAPNLPPVKVPRREPAGEPRS